MRQPVADVRQPATDVRQPATDTRPYGRMMIFTLLDDKAAEFDRAAEQVADQVRVGEPDTLVYVIHSVPDAPLQRIFYEIYRNRAAFDAHESMPYMERFAIERRAYVLATNVLELRLKYAKIAPLGQSAPSASQPAQLPSGRPPARPYAQPYAQPVQLPPQQIPLDSAPERQRAVGRHVRG